MRIVRSTWIQVVCRKHGFSLSQRYELEESSNAKQAGGACPVHVTMMVEAPIRVSIGDALPVLLVHGVGVGRVFITEIEGFSFENKISVAAGKGNKEGLLL